MADNFKALISAELDLDKIEQQIKDIENKKIQLKVEVDQDAGKRLAESISRGLKSTKGGLSDITKQLTDSFNISNPAVISKIRRQVAQIASEMAKAFDGTKINGKNLSGPFDNAVDGLANSLARNSGAIKSQMTDFYRSFYDDYKNTKIYISDAMKSALGSAYDDIAKSGRIVRDAAKGINLNEVWGEMSAAHPDILSSQLSNDLDQVQAFISAMKAAKTELKSALKFDDLDVSLQNEILGDAYANIGQSINNLKFQLEQNISSAADELKSEFILDVSINSEKLISDIRQAIQQTGTTENPVSIPIDINHEELRSKFQSAIQGISAENIPINIDENEIRNNIHSAIQNLPIEDILVSVDESELKAEIQRAVGSADADITLNIDRSELENDIRAALSGVDFPVDFRVDEDELRNQIRQAVAGLNDLEVDVNINVASLQNSLRQSIQNMPPIDIDPINRVNQAGRDGQDIFSAFGSTVAEAFSMFTMANLAEEAVERVIDAGREAIDTVKELDDAAMDLRMATGSSLPEARQMIADYNALGQELGALTTEVSSSADAWLRQGKTAAETETLIKDSMMLSKVAQIDSADSTKYLTSAMQGYKVAVEDVYKITDRLTSIDLVSATSADGLAEAMSRTAESADIAGVSMDRLLAMLAVTGEITQSSMSSVGNAYKTIFARMRDIKADKLSSVGDDGTVEDISYVEDTLSALGIKLRDSNQEFRNFQTVLDEVAASWDSYSSVQQAAISKAFAGQRQAENFLVMMENYDKVIKYTEVAANSEGTAAEKFSYYTESLEAKTKSLQASLEALASDVLSSELYAAFLDNAKAAADFATETDLVQSALAGLGTAGTTFVFTRLATLIRNTVTSVNQLGGGLTGLWSLMRAHPIALVTSAVTAGVSAWKMYKAAQEEQLESAKQAGSAWEEQNTFIQSQIDKITELRTALDSGTLSEEEAYQAKSDLFAIQQQLTESYGAQVSGIDLVNGALETQIGLLNQLSKAEADKFLNENTAGIADAVKEMEKQRTISLGTVNLNSEEGKKIQEIADKYQRDIMQTFNPVTGSLTLELNADATTAEATLNDFMTQLRNASAEFQNNDEYWFEGVYNAAFDGLQEINSVLEQYQTLYDQAQQAKLVADEHTFGLPDQKAQTATKWLNDYSKAIENYNNALLQGDTSKITEAANEFNAIDTAIQALLKDSGLSEYSDQFQEVRDQLNDTVIANNKFYKALEGNDYSKLGKDVKNYADQLKDLGLDDIDFMSGFGSEENVPGKAAIIGIASAAQKMGIITDTSSESLRNLANMLKQAGIISVDTAAQMETVADAAYDVSTSSNDLLSEIKAVNEALSSQAEGVSIDAETFNSEELAEYRDALEYVNGTLQLNQDKVKELTRAKVEEQIAINDATKAQKQQNYLENASQIEELKSKLMGLDTTSDDYATTLSELQLLQSDNSSIISECQQIDVLNASLRESIGLYQAWRDGQNAPQTGDMFDDTLTAMKMIEDVTKNTDSDMYGRVGRSDYQTSLDLIVPDTVDAEDTAAVNSYLESIANLFTYDDDGARAGLNISEFCRQATEQGLMVLDESGKNYKIAGQKTMQDFADGLGLSMPLVQAMFGEMEEFGASFDWSDEAFTTFGDAIFACTQEAEALQTQLDQLNADKAAGLEVDDSEIQATSEKLDEVITKKKELEQKSLLNIESNIEIDSQIEQAKQDVDGWKTSLEADPANVEIQANLADAEAKLSSLEEQKAQLQQPTQVEITAAVNNIDFQISDAQSQLENLNNKEYRATYNISDEAATQKIATLQGQIDALNQKKLELTAYADTNKANSDLDALEQKKVNDKSFGVSVIDHASSVLDAINNTVLNNKSFTITTTRVTKNVESSNGVHGVNGTAHVSGTAYVSGNWGTKKSGTALVGEMGTEIIVNSHTGRWYTVGDNGAEFVDIPKDSIVFNHLQTESLLKNGFVASRGTALASGTAMVTGGIPVSSAQKSTVYYKPYSGSNNNSGKDKDKSKATDKDTKTTNQHTEAVKKSTQVFDWVARRLQYFADKTKAIADTITDYVSYEFSNLQLGKQIKAVQKEITANQNGEKTYMAKADSIAQKYTYTGDKGKTKSLSIDKKYINRVQNGIWSIQDMDTSTTKGKVLAEAIQKYQEYYDKAQDCAEATRELTQTEKELRVQRLENIAANYDAKASLKASRISNIQSSMEVDKAQGKAYGTTYIANKNAENAAAVQKQKSSLQSNLKQKQAERSELLSQKNQLKVQLKTAKGSQRKNLQAQISVIDNKLVANKSAQKKLTNNLASIKEPKQINVSSMSEKEQYQTMIRASKDQQKILTKKENDVTNEFNKLVSNGTIKKGSAEWYKWKEDIAGIRDEINQCAVDQAEWNDAIDNIPLNKKKDDMTSLQNEAAKLNDEISLKNTKGIKTSAADYNNLITNSKAQVQNLKDQNVILQKQLSKTDVGTDKYNELLGKINDNNDAIRDATQSQEEWNNSIIALPIEKIERELELLDSIANLNKSAVDLKSAQGLDLSAEDYTTQMQDNNNQIEQWQNKANEYYQNMLAAMASTDGVYGGKTAEEWQQEMNKAGVQVNNLKSANEELKDAMRDDVYWRDFERTHEAAQRLKDEIDGIAGLISDDMIFDADGKLTDFGLSKVATNVKDLEIARGEVQKYTEGIQNLYNLKAQGYYNDIDEFNEKLAEQKQGLFDSAAEMKKYTDAIMDMYKNMGQAELDSLFEVIDARKEALTAKKG